MRPDGPTPQILHRLEALERKVEHIYAHLVNGWQGPAVIPPLVESQQGVSHMVVGLVRSGDIIGAIKQHRAETGCSLADAKYAIDNLV